jgi:DNA mismatch repair protein MutS
MIFQSVLFERPPDSVSFNGSAPPHFSDLNLDQIVDMVVGGGARDYLRPLYYTPLRDPELVRYRQEVVGDLVAEQVRSAIEAFTLAMHTVHERLDAADRSPILFCRDRLYLDAAFTYCSAVVSLRDALTGTKVASRGLRGLAGYLVEYSGSEAFTSLASDTRRQYESLAALTYNVHIAAGRVTVSRFEGERDYNLEVREAFARLETGSEKDYEVAFRERPDISFVEARILERVAQLFPEAFSALDGYCRRHVPFLDECLERFDREVQFYLAFLDVMEPLGPAGLGFCCPRVSAEPGGVTVVDAYDLALACKLIPEGEPVVVNSFHLRDPERVMVVTGPNQGGKTTFARMVGQLHYLAELGLPVPAREAHLFMPDLILTHFEEQERSEDLRGKLEDELLRARQILERATNRSLIIINEGFTSTTFSDALFLGREMLKRVISKGVTCVYVTFVDELASLAPETVSMVASVAETDPTRRTYRIVRGPASGLAYAAAIAEKYGLGYEQLRERLGP